MSGAGAGDVLRRLTGICGPEFAREAGAADEVAGVSSRWVAAPRTADAVGDVLRLAGDRDLTVVARGAGTKIDWGFPPSNVDIVLDTGRLADWHHPTGGDLLEVGAGRPVQATQKKLAESGQRIPTDVPSADATIGGVLASGETGSLRLPPDAPDDWLVGVDYVDASGRLHRIATSTGARPDEPDPVRLFRGSQGAFGVLVSATLRLQPAPTYRCWVQVLIRNPADLPALLEEAEAGAGAAAAEVDVPPAGPADWRQSGVGTLAVLLEGERGAVAERATAFVRRISEPARITDSAPDWWRRYPFGSTEVALRIEVPAEHIFSPIYALRDALGIPVAVRGSVANGILHAGLPPTLSPGRVVAVLHGLRSVLGSRQGRCWVVAAPPAMRRTVDLWDGQSNLFLLRMLKERHDPGRTLAPGRPFGV